MSQNVPGETAKADIALLESLRAKLMPLVYNLEGLKHEVYMSPNAPPNWPSIQRSIASLSGALSSIQTLINEKPENTAALRSLHAFPIPPFPIMDPTLGHLPEAILRKVPSPEENDWIIAKLAKAAEFAHVPGDWNIEAKKPVDEEEVDVKAEGVARVKRTRTILDEDQLSEVWNGALVAVKQAADVVDRNQNAEDDEDGDSEDEEMEDVEIVGGESAQNADNASPPPPVAQQPMMSLETIHRFMASGAVPH